MQLTRRTARAGGLLALALTGGSMVVAPVAAHADDWDESTTPEPAGSSTEVEGTVSPPLAGDGSPDSTVNPCAGGTYCAWVQINRIGAKLAFPKGSVNSWGGYLEDTCRVSGNPSGNWKNCASSVENQTDKSVVFWEKPNHTGPKFGTLKSGKHIYNLGTSGSMNDTIESSYTT